MSYYLGIRTKYLGATDTKGGRISATTSGGPGVKPIRVEFPYDHSLSVYENHEKRAILALTKTLVRNGCDLATAVARARAMKWHRLEYSDGYLFTYEVAP